MPLPFGARHCSVISEFDIGLVQFVTHTHTHAHTQTHTRTHARTERERERERGGVAGDGG